VTGNPNLSPELGIMTGLLGTVRWERDMESSNLLTLAIADIGLSDDSLAKAITKICNRQFTELIADCQNSEYLYKDKIPLIKSKL
jgi:hypothetical protein